MSKSGNTNQSSTGYPWALRFILLLFSLTLAACPAMAGQIDNIEYLHYTSVPGKSLVEIKGTSTLNDWSAKTGEVHGSVELIDDTEIGSCPEDKAFPLVAAEDVNLVFSIPVKSLKSDSQDLDEEIYKNLYRPEHSVITFRFANAAPIAPPESYYCSFKVKGDLQINGVKRPMNLLVKVKHQSAGLLFIEAETKVKMTDFKITPPTFMGGLLTSGDEVKIKLLWVLVPSQ